MSLSPHHGAGVRHPHFKEWYKMVKKICLMLVIDITENLHALKDCIFQELGLLFFNIITCESNKHKWHCVCLKARMVLYNCRDNF